MVRLFSIVFCALVLFSSACSKKDAEQPEPAGSLEGTWRVGLVDPTMYDAQNKVLVAFQPTDGAIDYTQLKFSPTELEQYNERTNARNTISYVRTGAQIVCPPLERSYTIRKLTNRYLDLYYRGDYLQVGASYTRIDLVIHLERQ